MTIFQLIWREILNKITQLQTFILIQKSYLERRRLRTKRIFLIEEYYISIVMPRKKKSAYEKYMAAQNSIKSILAKYDGNRETISTGRSIFQASKDEQFRRHENDYQKIRRLEKVVKEYENSSSALSSQDFLPPTAISAQENNDSPCCHSNCDHRDADVSNFSNSFFITSNILLTCFNYVF